MGDALAITALGITVCQGLIEALRSWKKFNKDIQEAEQKAQSLGELFKYLDSQLQQAIPGSAIDLLNKQLTRCLACIKSLEEETAKLQALQVANATKRRVSKGFQHIKYPVTKTHLDHIVTLLAELQDGLALAIQIYELDKTEQIKTHLKDASSRTDTALRSLSSTLNTLALDHVQSQRALSDIQADQQGLPIVMRESNNEIITALQNIEGHITQVPNAVRGTVNNSLAQVNDLALAIDKRLATQHLQLYRLLSTKPPSFQADLIADRRNSGVILDQRPHMRCNRNKKRQNAETSYTYTFRIPWWSQLVALTFYSTRGSGGQSLDSLGVRLRLKGFVHLNSPVLDVLNYDNRYESIEKPPADKISSLQAKLKRLEEVFHEGIASPDDILVGWEGGIFSYILEAFSYICFHHQLNPEEVYLCEKICDTAASLGIPMNEGGDGCGITLFEVLSQLYPKFSDLGLYFEVSKVSYVPLEHISRLLVVDEVIAEASGCGMVALAVISGDKERLERCLRKGGSVDEQEPVWGITPLHIACLKNWREGVEVLLNAGADIDILATRVISPLRGWTPTSILDYALESSSPVIVALILEKKPVMAINGRSELELLVSQSTKKDNSEKFELVIRDLRDRRIELAYLVQELDSDTGISNQVLDAEAWHVYQELSRKLSIPLYLRPTIGQTSSVFSRRWLTPSLAESLWSHGFLDVDTMDDDGYTPILLSGLVQGMLSWFLSKGVKLEARPPLETWAIVHHVGHHIGVSYFYDLEYHHSYKNHNWNQSNTRLHELFEALSTFDLINSACNLADDCRCACTSSGCTMLTAFLRRLWSKLHFGRYGDPVRCLSEALNIWTSFFALETCVGREQWLAGLRFVLFQEMYMEHTCCQLTYEDVREPEIDFHGVKPYRIKTSASESSEIQKIEAKDIGRLDAILKFASDLLDGRYSKFEDFAAYVLETFVRDAKPETLAMVDRWAGLDPEYSDQEIEDQEHSDEEYFDPENEVQESSDHKDEDQESEDERMSIQRMGGKEGGS